jgi:branched-chain amino acid transport system permease protein
MQEFILLLLIYLGIYTILALGLNLIAGYTGLLSLCQAAFFAIGSYTSAILMVKYTGHFWLIFGASGLTAAFFGLLIGLPTLRLKGDYLAIATLGFGEIVKNVILNWDGVTRGPMGISGIPAPVIFGVELTEKYSYLILIWLTVLATYFILRRLVRSRFGRALEAIREDEIAANAMGIHVTKYKILSFTIGAFFAGIGGSLWASYNHTVSVNTFDFMLSVMILCMVVLGGLGNNFATLIGTAIIVLTAELPRLLGFSSIIPPQVNQIIFGLILIVMMIYRPQGILGKQTINFGKIASLRIGSKGGSR